MTPPDTRLRASKRLGRNPLAARPAAPRLIRPTPPRGRARPKSRAPLQGGWMLGLRYLMWGTFLAGLRFVLATRSA